MNLNALASSMTRAITPAIEATWQKSTGYTKEADYTQVPSYAADATILIDVQPLDDRGLRQVDALNIQGVVRYVWAEVSLKGVDRQSGQGGDLLIFNDPSDGASATWLVHTLMEPWSVGWCHALVVKQVTP